MITELTAEVGGVRLAYALGPAAGPPIVLLHGVTRGWIDWTPVLSSLAARWQVWALDARGHGGSEWVGGKYFVVDYADDAIAFINSHLKEPSLIWGHSLGAMVAVTIAATTPHAVRGLILEDPPYHNMGRRIKETTFAALFKGLHSAVIAGGTVDQLARRIASIELPNLETGSTVRLSDLRDAAAIRFSARCLACLDPNVLTPLLAGTWLDGHDYHDAFSRIRCPTLLLQCDSSMGGALSDEDAALAETLIPDCIRVRLRGVGHQAHWLGMPHVMSLFHGFAESLR